MKILWVSPWFGNYRVPVYEELNKLSGGNFYLICSKEETSDLVRTKLHEVLEDNVNVLEGQTRIVIGNNSTTFANKALILKRQPGLYSAIKKLNPDIVIVEGFGSWAPAGILYSVLHRKKLCMFYERTKYVERNSPFYRTLYRRLVGLPVKHFFVNGTLTEEYLNDGLHFTNTPKTKGCMCADSFGLARAVSNVAIEDQTCLRDAIGLSEGLTYLFVGQLVERKGIRNLLLAWEKHIEKHPNDNLIVIGKGVLEEELKNRFQKYSSVHILGGISYDKIHQYYAICDVFIIPTLEDNWCLVLPEAMACGKPVACSIYNGGHYELVKDGVDGFNFDPKVQDSILNVLDKFHNADLKVMGQNAIAIESNFTPDKAAKRIFDACLQTFER